MLTNIFSWEPYFQFAHSYSMVYRSRSHRYTLELRPSVRCTLCTSHCRRHPHQTLINSVLPDWPAKDAVDDGTKTNPSGLDAVYCECMVLLIVRVIVRVEVFSHIFHSRPDSAMVKFTQRQLSSFALALMSDDRCSRFHCLSPDEHCS